MIIIYPLDYEISDITAKKNVTANCPLNFDICRAREVKSTMSLNDCLRFLCLGFGITGHLGHFFLNHCTQNRFCNPSQYLLYCLVWQEWLHASTKICYYLVRCRGPDIPLPRTLAIAQSDVSMLQSQPDNKVLTHAVIIVSGIGCDQSFGLNKSKNVWEVTQNISREWLFIIQSGISNVTEIHKISGNLSFTTESYWSISWMKYYPHFQTYLWWPVSMYCTVYIVKPL